MLYEVIMIPLFMSFEVDALWTCKPTEVVVAVRHAEEKHPFTLRHTECQSLRPDELIIGEASTYSNVCCTGLLISHKSYVNDSIVDKKYVMCATQNDIQVNC